MRWMKLEPIIQSEVSQKDKDQYSILTHICVFFSLRVLGLHCSARTFCGCGERGLLLAAVPRLLFAECMLWVHGLRVEAHGFSSCGSWALWWCLWCLGLAVPQCVGTSHTRA